MKAKILKITNPILFLSGLIQFTTVTFFKLHDWTGLEFPRWIFSTHVINGFTLLGLIVLHTILNWGWIKTNIFRIKAK